MERGIKHALFESAGRGWLLVRVKGTRADIHMKLWSVELTEVGGNNTRSGYFDQWNGQWYDRGKIPRC